MVEEKLEIIQAFPGLEALDIHRLKKGWGRSSPGFIEDKISLEEEEPVLPAGEAQGRGADSQVETTEGSASTMKTKAEGVLRLGPNVRQVHIVKDQEAIRTLKANPICTLCLQGCRKSLL